MVFEAIAELIAERVEKDISEIKMESTFRDLGIDSLDMTEIMCEIEDAFNIDFGEPEGLETVGQMVAHIEGLL